jgi:hypothetical protein
MQKSTARGSQGIGVSVGGIVGEIVAVGVVVAVGGSNVDVGTAERIFVGVGSSAEVTVCAGVQDARRKKQRRPKTRHIMHLVSLRGSPIG